MQFDTSAVNHVLTIKRDIRAGSFKQDARLHGSVARFKNHYADEAYLFFLIASLHPGKCFCSAQKITLTEKKASLQKLLREIRRQAISIS